MLGSMMGRDAGHKRRPEVRSITRHDLAALEASFYSEFGRSHADDLADQDRGEKSFLVAWWDGSPVAHVLVNWRGARQPEPAEAFPGCPEIFRLGVSEPYRGRGIATELLRACEAKALYRGHTAIGLRLGYGDSGIGLFDDVYQAETGGRVHTVRAPTRFLVKQLHRTP